MAESKDEFHGKVALVTGSSSGIGRAIALHLATRGAFVVLCGRNNDKLSAALDECAKASGGNEERFLSQSGDVNDAEFRRKLLETTIGKFGRLDILVCNAGALDPKDGLATADEACFDFHMNVLVKSVFFLVQEAVPHLEKSHGNIVAVSSICSRLAFNANIVYATAKAAVDHMARCMALELAPRGVRVNTVNPSYVSTNIFRDGTEEENAAKTSQVATKAVEYQPYERRIATAEEVAETVAFLASNRASFITGQNLFVDGGRTLLGLASLVPATK